MFARLITVFTVPSSFPSSPRFFSSLFLSSPPSFPSLHRLELLMSALPSVEIEYSLDQELCLLSVYSVSSDETMLLLRKWTGRGCAFQRHDGQEGKRGRGGRNLCRFVGYERLQFTCDAWPVNGLVIARETFIRRVKDARKIIFFFFLLSGFIL